MSTINTNCNAKERLTGIDSMRFVAIVAVIFLHCFPVTGTLKILVDQSARFAVPFFFVTSGYFLAAKLSKQDKPAVYLQYVKKLFILYLAWNLLYLLDPAFNAPIMEVYASRFRAYFSQPLEEVLLVGVSGHFWFFMSLILTVLFFMLFGLKNLQYFVATAVLLYCFGVLGKAYAVTPIGLPVPFNTRNFIFFSSLPFALGIYLYQKKVHIPLNTAIMFTLLGLFMHFTEAWLLRTYYASDIQDYGFSTFLMGVGTFSLAKLDFGILKSAALSNLGKLTLGIYASHIVIAKRLHIVYVEPFVSVWFIVWPLLVLALAILLTKLLLRIKFLKFLV